MQDAFQASITNLDVDAYLGFLAPPVEFRFARDGVLVRGIHDEVRHQFGLVDSLSCEWPDRTVTVLSRQVAAVTTTYRCEGRNKDGATWAGGGAWTNVIQRRLDQWVIVEAHESHLPPETR
jgi:ketosteroid isomerase-like protein